MALGIAIAFFCIILLSITAYGYRLYAKPGRIEDRLKASSASAAATAVIGPSAGPRAEKKWLVRVVQQIGEAVPVSPQDVGMSRRYLIAAGYRSDTAVKVYYGLKIVLAVALFFAALFLRAYIDNSIGRIIIVIAGVAAGFFGPNLFVERMVSKRQEAIRFSLPDALDMMIVCMEAGLGLDQAMSAVSRELQTTHKEISEEFSLVTLEMRAGKRRMEALKNLADRAGEPELRKLVATMIQADRFGTGVAEALRTHSEFMRVKRRQEAEERAAKIGVKLVFPIFFFILPSMLIVAAGPGLLMLFKQLFPMMNAF